MAIESFFFQSGHTDLYCFPFASDVLLSTYATNRRLATETTPGVYTFNAGSTYRFWRLFLGAGQPTSWDAAMPDLLEVIDEADPLAALPGIIAAADYAAKQTINAYIDVSAPTFVDFFGLDGQTPWNFNGQQPELSIAKLNGATIAKVPFADLSIVANRITFSLPLAIRKHPGTYSFSFRDTVLGNAVIAEGDLICRFAARRLP